MKKIQQGYRVYSPDELQFLAQQLAQQLTFPATILLNGELGAGKTTFTKGLAKGLHITETIKSPTYTLVREYDSGRLKLYHLDVYRLENCGEEALGFEDYFETDGVAVVEWSQFIKNSLPQAYLLVHINRVGDGDTQREIVFDPVGEKYENVVHLFEEAIKI